MKKQNLLAVAVFAALGASTTASAVPFVGDYEDATSAFEDAYVVGSFNAVGGRDEGVDEETQSSYSFSLGLDYDKVFSSPNRNTTLFLDASGTADKGSEPGAESTTDYDIIGSVTVDNYINPTESKLFWYGGLEVESTKDAENVGSEITVGLGYGRVVNVTPMARSIRIIENLRLKGFLSSDPSDDVYQQVAKIIDKEDEYESTHGRDDYEQYWVQDIQAAIQASGAASGPLNARAILSSFDVLTTEAISQRRIGWLVRAGIGAELSSLDGEEDGNPLFELIGEYHRPFGNKWQFSNVASFETTLRDDDDEFEFNNDMSLTYELTDTVDWINDWNLNHVEFDESATTNTLSSTFLYELNNQLDFNVTASVIDFEDASNDERISMGLTYRLK